MVAYSVKYLNSVKYLKNRVSEFTSLLFSICVISILTSYCTLHAFWLSTTDGVAQRTISELKIASMTVYMIVGVCGLLSMTQVSKATVDKLSYDFSQWRLLGFSPSEVQRVQFLILCILSLCGAAFGSVISALTAWAVLPSISMLALGGLGSEEHLPSYNFSLPALCVALLVSAGTSVLLGAYGTRAAKAIQPLKLLRSHSERLTTRYPRLKLTLSITFAVFASLLVCCFPLVRQLNGGAEAMYNLFLYIGISLSVSIYLIIDRGAKLMLFGLRRSQPRPLLKAVVLQEYITLRPALNVLYIGVAFGALMALCTAGVGAYVKRLNSSSAINYIDTAFVVAIIVIISITTAASLLNLATGDTRKILNFTFRQGMSPSESSSFVLKLALISMLTLLLQSYVASLLLGAVIGVATGIQFYPLVLLATAIHIVAFAVFSTIRTIRLFILLKQISRGPDPFLVDT